MPVLPYLDHTPTLAADVRVAADAVVVGKVTIDGPAVIGAGAVLRGDQSWIGIDGPFHLGQGATVHTEVDVPTRIAGGAWVGDRAVVHASTLGENVRVEDGGLVLSGASVGSGSIVAARSLVPENATFEPNSYISGVPGRRLRDTTPEERGETSALLRAALGGPAAPSAVRPAHPPKGGSAPLDPPKG
jgi:carbonic anhydrase/acetyltransferase-like protein (isoleucine patch superfamily)